MDALQFSWPVGYRSQVGLTVTASYITYSVSPKLSIVPPRGSVRVQE